MLTLLKFLKQGDRFTYIASGSLLGIALAKTSSIPIGSIETEHMYPLDFEEFLWANGFNEFSVQGIRNRFLSKAGLDEPMHAQMMMDLFKNDVPSINLGAVYETVVAQQLAQNERERKRDCAVQ